MWPSNAIWRHICGLTLAPISACSLMAPSHYLNRCWLANSMVKWFSSEGNLTNNDIAISHCINLKINHLKFHNICGKHHDREVRRWHLNKYLANLTAIVDDTFLSIFQSTSHTLRPSNLMSPSPVVIWLTHAGNLDSDAALIAINILAPLHGFMVVPFVKREEIISMITTTYMINGHTLMNLVLILSL